jgi:uroporphyrinogen III methyltransferase/synthase
MGITKLHHIAKRLIQSGMSPDTPVAIVEWGTQPFQRTICGKLEEMQDIVEREEIKPPGVVCIGDVVRLREKLNWFESKPFFGKGVLVTRPITKVDELTTLLEQKGAIVYRVPFVRIKPSGDLGLERAIEEIERYEWVIFTSRNAVKYFLEALSRKGKDIRDLKGVKIACIGSKTRSEIERFRVRVEYQPKEYRSKALCDGLCERWQLRGKRILLPTSNEGGEELREELRKVGAVVCSPVTYLIERLDVKREILQLLLNKKIQIVTLTSSSIAEHFMSCLEGENLSKVMDGVKVACIGPVTAKVVQSLGDKNLIVAKEYTAEGLVRAIVEEGSDSI